MTFVLDSELLADHTLIFLVIHDKDMSVNERNDKWKIFFYQDLTKQTQ